MYASLFVEIFMPLAGLAIVLMCCTALCRACRSANEERQERADTAPIYIIPFPDEDRAYRPPSYNVVDFSDLPPPYMEVEMKPELFPYPEGVPPPYTERNASAPSAPPLPPPAPPLPPTPPPLLRSMSH